MLPAQLAARAGLVRCGKCLTVFDGGKSLVSGQTLTALPEEPGPQTGLSDLQPSAAAQGAPTGSEGSNPKVEPPTAPVQPPPATELAEQAQAAPVPAATPVQAAGTGTVSLRPPEFLADKRKQASFIVTWSLLAVLSLAAFVMQAVLHFRTEIAVLLPATRAPLETLCGMLGCEVRLPRRAELMSIESSDLQADAQRPGVIVLNALLRNRAPFLQEYPALELTLTDQRDEAVVRRVLAPSDYLQEKRAAVAQGIAGGAEEAVGVYLDTSRIRATGYRLYLFYP